MPYDDLISSWRRANDPDVRKHAQNVDAAFLGLFQNIKKIWPEQVSGFPLDYPQRIEMLLKTILEQLSHNFQHALFKRSSLPSRENWRWPKPVPTLAEQNKSGEVSLERNFIRACERRRLSTGNAYRWANQVPVASGVGNAFGRRRGIDLLEARGPHAFNFVELKIASDDPLSAARQIVEYGFLWLISRKHKAECQYSGVLMEANDVCLSVLAPQAYFRKSFTDCIAFQMALNKALGEIGYREGVMLGFEFQTLAGDYSPENAYSDDEMLALIENRKVLTPVDGLPAC